MSLRRSERQLAVRVLIAVDHAIFRRGLMEILEEEFPKIVFGEARTALETLEFVRQRDWEIIILDASMPGECGLDILDELKRLRPKLPVLLLSTHPEERPDRGVLKAGASGYLTKESMPEELRKAVYRVLSDAPHVSNTLAEQPPCDLRQNPETPLHELLSDREFQVLRMIASGKSGKEIGNELSLSVKTVSTYRTRILEKTGMSNNAELIRYAVQNHLVD